MTHVRACPCCSSSRVSHSRRRGFAERLFSVLTGVRPYRCLACETRFFLLPLSCIGGRAEMANAEKNRSETSMILQKTSER